MKTKTNIIGKSSVYRWYIYYIPFFMSITFFDFFDFLMVVFEGMFVKYECTHGSGENAHGGYIV